MHTHYAAMNPHTPWQSKPRNHWCHEVGGDWFFMETVYPTANGASQRLRLDFHHIASRHWIFGVLQADRGIRFARPAGSVTVRKRVVVNSFPSKWACASWICSHNFLHSLLRRCAAGFITCDFLLVLSLRVAIVLMSFAPCLLMTKTTLVSTSNSGQPCCHGNPKDLWDFAQNHIKITRFSIAFIWFS